ncbi:hypothetical protein LZ480_00075 [Solibacillus sp. MA9]|uniref:Uncharacterized protein n=1 Tax=Solibacillus palustris TaxID=2908203 RepID=A0ABS9U7G9_9BACL|nr:hypothetical protein [Solibacillus sp. MA9]MCH7320267.1 hypothetical protein [Solibacillus sp. MA9]
MFKRNMLFALVGALIIHIAYVLIQLLIGIIQTFFYQPQFAPNDVILQSEVAFGFMLQGAPLILLGSYFIVAVVLFTILNTKEALKRKVRGHDRN